MNIETIKEASTLSSARAAMWRRILSRKKFMDDPWFFIKNFRNWMIYLLFLKRREKAMKIIQYPNPILSRVCDHVDFNSMILSERTKLSTKLCSTLLEQVKGQRLGLAAPQIGINLRVFVFNGKVAFNPDWNPVKVGSVMMQEGCYSVPNQIYVVERAKYGWAKWYDQYGEFHEKKLTGIDAIIFQHELDHLNGKCLPDIGEKL